MSKNNNGLIRADKCTECGTKILPYDDKCEACGAKVEYFEKFSNNNTSSINIPAKRYIITILSISFIIIGSSVLYSNRFNKHGDWNETLVEKKFNLNRITSKIDYGKYKYSVSNNEYANEINNTRNYKSFVTEQDRAVKAIHSFYTTGYKSSRISNYQPAQDMVLHDQIYIALLPKEKEPAMDNKDDFYHQFHYRSNYDDSISPFPYITIYNYI